jgi:hypothetical protein
MALVGEAGLLCNLGEGLVCLLQQGFCTLEPTMDDTALRPNPGRLLERAAEVIRAQTDNVGKDSEPEVIVEMGLDVVAHAPQTLRREALVAGGQSEVPTKHWMRRMHKAVPRLSIRILSAKPPLISWAKVVTI